MCELNEQEARLVSGGHPWYLQKWFMAAACKAACYSTYAVPKLPAVLLQPCIEACDLIK